MEIESGVNLKDWTWWKIGGPADYFCLPESEADLLEVANFARRQNLPITILGGGTNVLVSDDGVEGLVVCMRRFSQLQVQEQGGRLYCEALAGTKKSELTKEFLKRHLSPALFLCGLPGDVGGGVVMNAGVREDVVPREFGEIIDWLDVFDWTSAQTRRFKKGDVRWHYRHSEGWQPGLVVRIGVSWPLEKDESVVRQVKEATRQRVQRQPLEWPTCGSTFKNPLGAKAGALIEQCGLKGYKRGGAEISTKHANFIINLGGAKAREVDAIIRYVQSEVQARFQVRLETEVKYLGRWA